MKYEIYFKHLLNTIEEALEKALPAEGQRPSAIHEAMRYAVFPRGKRFRAVLTLSAAEAAGGRLQDALLPAIALELIHSYSLVHDDLPALDNDATRRGKPSCHKRFGEAVALLAGDGLLTLAFQVLSRYEPAERLPQLLEEISTAAGSYGMIGGQVAELTTGKENLDLPMLDFISTHKTGKLIKAGAAAGAIAVGASQALRERMMKLGEFLGLAFQLIDDLLDGDGYARLMKPKEIRDKVRDLIASAKRETRPLGKKAEKLQTIADFLLQRLPRISHVAVG